MRRRRINYRHRLYSQTYPSCLAHEILLPLQLQNLNDHPLPQTRLLITIEATLLRHRYSQLRRQPTFGLITIGDYNLS